jgi:hypothetical protein
VLENDLTRCLSIGDVTVVWAARPWARPLLAELKTTGVRQAGADVLAEVDFLSPVSSIPEDEELTSTFHAALGLQTREHERSHYTENQAARERRQTSELLAGAERLLKATTNEARQLSVKESLWPRTREVLERAMQTGYAFDLVEPGLVYVGWRQILRGDDVFRRNQQQFLRLMARLREPHLLPSAMPFRWIGSLDLHVRRRLSSVAPPIPLWPMPMTVRAALLRGDLVFACGYTDEVWRRALAPHGITLEARDGAWYFGRGKSGAVLNPTAVRSISVGVALSGMSPRSFGESVAAFIDRGSASVVPQAESQ